MDRGSTDGTVDILRSYGEHIQWVSESDKGHADAINKGWWRSKGEILAWLNADDVYASPEALQTAVDYLQEHPEVDVVYGDCGSIDATGNVVGMSYLHEWDLSYAVINCDHCIPQPAAFIRRSVLERVGWLDTAFYQKKDHELWLRIGLVRTIQHIPVLLAHARDHPGNFGYQGDHTAAACVQLTEKFFTLPGVPSALRAQRARAMSNAYLRGADCAWQYGRHTAVAMQFTLQAVRADPSNWRRTVPALESRAAATVREEPALGWLRPLLRAAGSPAQRVAEVLTYLGTEAVNSLRARDIEWSWVVAQMGNGPGRALDFGNGGSYLSLVAARRGYEATAVDLLPVDWLYRHPNLRFIQGDMLNLGLPPSSFELIINCSSIEHVGLAGRYGVTEDNLNGDLETMAVLQGLLKPGGTMLLTVPVGRDTVFRPLHRVYGPDRLPRLLTGWDIAAEEYWLKDDTNYWTRVERAAALERAPKQELYGLGLFVLRKSMTS